MKTRAGKGRFWNQEQETLAWEQRLPGLEKRFLATFRHAAKNSPAYAEILAKAGIEAEDIKGFDDLEKIPILRMQDIVERQRSRPPFGGFETVDPSRVRRVYINPGRIFQPGEWDYEDTSWAEALAAAGFGPGDLVINTFNYHLWPYAFMMDESAKMVGATVAPTGVGNTLMQVKIIKDLKVNAFMGTPSFLMTLTQRAEGMGLDVKKDLALDKAMVGAEMLPESLRKRLQEKLGMEIRQAYGTVFLGCLGYECSLARGLHVPDNVLVEVVDPATGKAAPKGVAGEIVATTFNPVYPLVRLATGDLSLWAQEPCACGRTSGVLRKVLGRVDQATKVRGTFLHPWQTDEIAAKYPEIFKYQVIITRKDHTDHMSMVVEVADDYPKKDILKARLERDLKDLLTIKGEARVVRQGSIPDFHKKIDDKRTWE